MVITTTTPKHDPPHAEQKLFSHPPTERQDDTENPSTDRQISYENLFREPTSSD